MIAKDLISDMISPLKTSDTVETAISLMDELRVSHLPIVNNRAYLGLVSDIDLQDHIENIETPLGNIKLSLARPMITSLEHIFDVIKMINDQRLTVLPVIDQDENYLGSVSLKSLSRNLSKMAAIHQPGTIIVLEMSENDYSLSEIAQIVESNDAKILSVYISSSIDSTTMELVIKVNKQDVTGIINTFNRYDYSIKAFYGREEDKDDLKDRFDSLMNYLNV
jgi:predicted transcriptional regulator